VARNVDGDHRNRGKPMVADDFDHVADDAVRAAAFSGHDDELDRPRWLPLRGGRCQTGQECAKGRNHGEAGNSTAEWTHLGDHPAERIDWSKATYASAPHRRRRGRPFREGATFTAALSPEPTLRSAGSDSGLHRNRCRRPGPARCTLCWRSAPGSRCFRPPPEEYCAPVWPFFAKGWCWM